MNKADHPFYRRWAHMRARCNCVTDPDYHNYGGRGITVCPRWDNFWLFVEDMGPCPPNHTLDRINCNGNYEPSNCRWASHKSQAANRRIVCRLSTPRKGLKLIHKHGHKWVVRASLCTRRYATSFETLNEAISHRSDIEFEREMHRRLGLTYK